MKMMHDVVLSVGSNINPEQNIPFSLKAISEHLGLLQKRSRFFLTEPWGYSSENKFINYVCQIKTTLTPVRLLHVIKKIEKNAGRAKHPLEPYGDRPLDIDILFYDDIIHISRTLIIPHPYIHLRRFVLQPLVEIIPQMTHPIFKMSVEELYQVCTDVSEPIPVEWIGV